MADSPHLHSPDFAATLETACDDFHAALTRRWRNEVCAAALAARHDFPTVVRREVSPHAEGRMWEYWTVPAQQHLHSHTGCAYVR